MVVNKVLSVENKVVGKDADTGNRGAILVIDDDPSVLDVVATLLDENSYPVIACNKSEESISFLKKNSIALVVSDVRMPGLNGLELLDEIHAICPELPVILMTALPDVDLTIKAIKKGAFDFIAKPFRSFELIAAVEKAYKFSRLAEHARNYTIMLEETVNKKTFELQQALIAEKESSLELIRRLTRIAEYRDTDTGAHISRIGLFAGIVARAMERPATFIEAISYASPMHDIGKVGIPDSILLKQGPFTPEEFKVMMTHSSIGANILHGSMRENLRMASVVALTHHERWDGSGYPNGLKAAEIPVEGMIAMICDQYDAIRSKRPYKKPIGHDDAIAILSKGDGRTRPEHFDPRVLGAFLEVQMEIKAVFEANRD